MRDDVEREVKLVPGDGFQLPTLGVPQPDRAFVSTYLDTPDLRLARHGVTFRHRSEDGTGVWQLKIPLGDARIELEEPGPPARPPGALFDLLAGHLRGRELVRVARLRTRRQTQLADGAEIVDDSVAVLEGQRVTARFRELEVELLDGDEEVLRRLEQALRDAGAVGGDFTPKLYRVLDLVYPPEQAAVLPEDASPVDVVRAALAEQYARLLAHDPGTRLGTDPEDLHQMRVATRRARAYLRAAKPLLDETWTDELRDELGWLGSALGPARDLDVLLEHLREEVSDLGAEERLAPLVESLEKEHATARATAVAALSDPRYFALLDRLETADPVAVEEAEDTLAELWWSQFERTRKAFRKLAADSADEELHAGRIFVKRARYSAELAGNELGKRGEKFVDAAKRLQDVLGEHQDASVAGAQVNAWVEREPAGAAAAARLLEREDERRRLARAEWPGAWKRLEKRAEKARRR